MLPLLESNLLVQDGLIGRVIDQFEHFVLATVIINIVSTTRCRIEPRIAQLRLLELKCRRLRDIRRLPYENGSSVRRQRSIDGRAQRRKINLS